ncbi:SMI1/KNR4 family protein [Streptomyces sp. NPDC005492]|uniref:SMI1/KNR4 family protein n=1 Tax=Streptomyces sp. NPDC005492 TaxID=3156883 RepID=UPI0033AF2A1B
MTEDAIIHAVRARYRAGERPPTAPPEAVTELEGAVGYPMPALLRRIHLEVADGGFGRRGEALSLTDREYRFSDSGRLVEEYLRWRRTPGHPPSVVPLLTWGCAIWSLVDFSTPEGRMWGWDPNARCPWHGEALFPEDFTLAERLQGWLDGDEVFPAAPVGPDAYCTEG